MSTKELPVLPAWVIYSVMGLLLLAPLPWPYGYYTLLRVAACGAFCWAAYLSLRGEVSFRSPRWARKLGWGCAVLAVVFNPLFPLHLDRSLWFFIDVFSAGFLWVWLKQQTPSTAS